MPARELTPPHALSPSHVLEGFYCGEPTLDTWLLKRALQSEAEGASRTYVVCETTSGRVVGFYCLSTGAVQRATAPGGVRRNMPEPIPVMVLGRLAVSRAWQGQGLGRGFLRDAVLRTLQAADIAGIRALLVHALNENARHFYEKSGFQSSPVDPLILMLRLSDARNAAGRD